MIYDIHVICAILYCLYMFVVQLLYNYIILYIYFIIHTHAIRFCKQNTVVIVLFRARSEQNSPTLSQVTLPFDVQPEEPAAPRLRACFAPLVL